MFRIVNHYFKRICEDGCGFLETDAMFRLIEQILASVPFNFIFSSISLHAMASILIFKMVSCASMMQMLLAHNLPQNMRQHLAPPGPIVIHVRAPQFQTMRNLFALKNV